MLVTINPTPLRTVFKAFIGRSLAKSENLYTAGLPFLAFKVVTVVPSLFATVISTSAIEFVEITSSFALLKYCQGAGAM
ncbi:hypothetical protein D3C85_161480 [compost metagenome]